MENPNLISANAHMTDMLHDLNNAGCMVISAYLDRYHNIGPQFMYHIHLLYTPEATQWIGERGYKGSYDPAKSGRFTIPFPDGEVFYRV